MFKKLLALTLALVLCLTFVACDIADIVGDTDSNDNGQESVTGGLFGTDNIEEISPYTIEYKDMGDGTCHVTGITVMGLIPVNVITGGTQAQNDIKYMVTDGKMSDPSSTQTTYTTAYYDTDKIDIVIPDTSPEGLKVVAIDFDGFDYVVPERMGSMASYQIFADYVGDEFENNKFLSYYECNSEDGVTYTLAGGLSKDDIMYLSEFMLNDLMLDYGDFKRIYHEIGEDVPNIAIQVTSITVPSTVKSISDGAFAWCYNLEKCHIPEGVEYNNSIFLGSKLYKE